MSTSQIQRRHGALLVLRNAAASVVKGLFTPTSTVGYRSIMEPLEKRRLLAFDIQFTYGALLNSNASAKAALNEAASVFENLFTDNMVVEVSANFDNTLPSGVLAATSPTMGTASYASARTQLINDAAADETIVSSLPTSMTFSIPK